MRVPFVDLKTQYQNHRTVLDAAVADVISRSAFVGGETVRAFEEEYAKSYDVKHCISCANGTDAIYIALRMLGIGPGDEVITTASSWISTSEAVSQTGAKPVFVDVDEYFNIDARLIEAAVTPQTRALLPVHLYGQSAEMDVIVDICRRHNLLLLEDCAQAHFAEFGSRRVGTFGVAGTFSFYPGKNLGAWGDAGAIITNDDAFARRCRMYANHGALVKHEHEMEGVNSRLDGLQAAVLRAKLPLIGEWTAARRRVARMYESRLAGAPGVSLPEVRAGSTHVYHLFVVRSRQRDAMKKYLELRGIETAIHYPTALPLLPAYAGYGISPKDVPRAYRNQGEILSLPMYPEMTESAVAYVCDAIVDFLSAAS